MAINAYTGLPGSGKSYGVVENVLVPALQKGRCVWTNIPVNEDKMAAFAGALPHPFSMDDIRKNPRWFQDVLPKGAVLILDECWRLWPSGLKANNIAEDHKSFLAEHRHMVGDDNYSTEIYLVTQDLAQVASFVRQLVDTTYRASKLSAIGANKKFRVDIYDGAVTGQKPPKDKIVRKIFGSYKPQIYSLYQSHTMSDTGSAGDETSSDGRKNIFKGTAAKSILVVFVVGVVFVIYGFGKVRDFYAPTPKAVAAASNAGAAQVQIKPPEDIGYLDGRTVSIASNIDTGTGPDFVFRVEDGNQFTRLTTQQLMTLGYSIGVINECLTIINGHGHRYYAQCFQDVPRQGLNLVDATVDHAKAGS